MAFDLTALLGFAKDQGASDLHLSAGMPPMLRLNGEMVKLDMPALSRDEAHAAIYDILQDDQKRIFEETRLTASAGVAPNKFLAKIASGWKKPDGLTVIHPDRVEPFLQQLPVDALWGVGPVTARKLRARGIERVVDVRSIEPEKLNASEATSTASS